MAKVSNAYNCRPTEDYQFLIFEKGRSDIAHTCKNVDRRYKI